MTKPGKVDGPQAVVLTSPLGVGGTTPQPALDDITDVDTTGVADGDVVIWDSGSSTWIASPQGAFSLTVEDEGTPLASDATTLDFVGAGVVASGTGATKTITISGGPGGGTGGLTLLEQHTASASATLDFTTFISSTYDDYVFRFIGLVNATNSQDFLMRMGTGGGPTYDTGNVYSYENDVWRAGAAAVSGATAASAIKINFNGATVSNSAITQIPVSGHADFYMPQSTAYYKQITGVISYCDGTFRVNNMFDGRYESTTAVTAVRFFFASGNITSGTIRVYGMEK